ncbi:hypothetical protein SAMN06298214_0583 [Bacteroidales bacterium WCE2004]|nr:hypothetical protein SAMN06298214_0583 [Bacteroidales bacterium WCE2004]
MNKRLLLVLLLALTGLQAFCQSYDVLDIIASDRQKNSGCEGPYRFDAPALTPAPKGFKPFYISHYGRHGSRYAWTSDAYTVVRDVLQAAYRAGALTERGERLHNEFRDFMQTPLINTGDLVELGSEQHAEIARRMVASFPDVFAKGGKVSARSSTSQRAIVSMGAFCVSLQKNAPRLDIELNSLHTNMPVVNATSAPAPLRVRRSGRVLIPESPAAFTARLVDYDGILDRLFTDRGFLEERGGRSRFVSMLFSVMSGYHNYCEEDFLEDIFTPEEQLALWEVDNYVAYVDHAGNRYQQIPLLLDIVAGADEAIAGGQYKAHFRFGHDTVFNGLCPLLNINGSGFQPQKADEVKYWFQNYDTPMAANLQFVLYRSKRDARVLFKLLRNGWEVSLPQLTPVSGPYYDWNDFRAWVQQLDSEHPVAPERPAR